MTFAHEAVAALPVLTSADKALIRALVTRRYAYALTSGESATDFVAVDPDAGTIPLYLIQNNILFQYDSTDTTTAHDGVTCLVTSDGKRYKSDTITYPWSVDDKDRTAQPVSPAPSVGDRYIIPTAATGTDWAGQDGKIGIYTAAGWRFATVPIGRFVYVEDETAFYHRNASGVWTAGVGSLAYGAASIPITAVIGATASFIVKVENQTTNTPPASPVAPVAYIIGSAPTGAWAGNVAKLAICLVSGTFTIITPAEGDEVYDKAQDKNFRWNGSSWISASGAFTINILRFTANGTYSKPTRLIGIIARVIGGGGGSASSNGGATGTTGGTSSLGSLLSATGGVGGSSAAGGAGGAGSGGDINRSGQDGGFWPAGITAGGKHSRPLAPLGSDKGGGGRAVANGGGNALGDGGAGGGAEEWLTASELASNETVTVGAGGGNAGGGTFESGQDGEVYIIEFIED